jgi:hypothetical protein
MVSFDAEETLLLREEPTMAVSGWLSTSRVCSWIRLGESSDWFSPKAVFPFFVEDLESMVDVLEALVHWKHKIWVFLRHSRSGGCQSVPDSREPIGFITVGK